MKTSCRPDPFVGAIGVIVLSLAEFNPPEQLSGQADVIKSLYRKLINATTTPAPDPVDNCLLKNIVLPEGWYALPAITAPSLQR